MSTEPTPTAMTPTPAIVDPGSNPTLTPNGTGRLGHPVGDALTWAPPGSNPSPAAADASIGSSTPSGQLGGALDGAGA